MIKKRVIILISFMEIAFAVLLIGCGSNETGEDIGKRIEDGAKKTNESAFDLGANITDTNMDYDKDALKTEVEAKGYIAKEILEVGNSYFSVENIDYIINDEKFSVYQYNKEDKNKLEEDLNSITDNGMKINNVNINWKKAPHIYKKGRLVVIYDGDNEVALTEAKEILGTPILG